MTTQQVLGVNPDLNPGKLIEGSTILLPAGKLSARDLEILAGIGTGYRLYPVRAGETISDIMSKRKIVLSEMQALNPGVNLNKVSGACGGGPAAGVQRSFRSGMRGGVTFLS